MAKRGPKGPWTQQVVIDGRLVCRKCNDLKLVEAFYLRRDGRYDMPCKDCHRANDLLRRSTPEYKARIREYNRRRYTADDDQKAKMRAANKAYYLRHRGVPQPARRKARTYHERKYGLSPAEFQAMLAAQDGRCAVCQCSFEERVPDGQRGAKRRQAHVDHDHSTGAIRGLLCGHCNSAAGMLRDSPRNARALARYLETHPARIPINVLALPDEAA